MDFFISTFQYAIYFYGVLLSVLYVTLAVLAYINILRHKRKYTSREERILLKHPEIAPPISIVAPAFNEEVIVIDSVTTLLGLDYPNFEVVIVNDGSKDRTLDLLIEEFSLQEVPYAYIEKVPCKPVKRILRSTDPRYGHLTVVDKVNGGTKADAMNAGVNVARHDYFINTDVDCILANNTLTRIILPVLNSEVEVIAVGATMRMANGCEVEHGRITSIRPPDGFIPTFQETEYLRSYVVAKMGWAMLGAIPNVSGGFGLFKKDVVIDAGGFDPQSHAEDMDMTLRMIAHMKETGRDYRIEQVPDTLCWTEGPPNLKILSRQRTRWGRGLLQIFIVHRKFLFNPKYGRMGLITMPYALFFELLAPFIEFIGSMILIYLLVTRQVNLTTFWLLLGYVYLAGICISLITITYDLTIKRLYSKFSHYLKLILFSSVEIILYHPLIVIFSVRGYIQMLSRKDFKWGSMTRQGFSQKQPQTTPHVNKK